jgi:hypothetical protein
MWATRHKEPVGFREGKWKTGGSFPSSPPCPEGGEAHDTPVSCVVWRLIEYRIKTESEDREIVGGEQQKGRRGRKGEGKM